MDQEQINRITIAMKEAANSLLKLAEELKKDFKKAAPVFEKIVQDMDKIKFQPATRIKNFELIRHEHGVGIIPIEDENIKTGIDLGEGSDYQATTYINPLEQYEDTVLYTSGKIHSVIRQHKDGRREDITEQYKKKENEIE